MKAHVHRQISQAVAEQIWPDVDCSILVSATETMDAVRTVPRHHPTRDTDNIAYIDRLIRQARRLYLKTGYSDKLLYKLGDIFHLVQDGFISSDCLERHNEVEARVSRFLPQFPFYGINAQSLRTESEVTDFARREIRPLEDPEEILARAFKVCLSIGQAVKSPRADLDLGEFATHAVLEANALIQEVESECSAWLDKRPAKALQQGAIYFDVQISEMEAAILEVADGRSALQRILGSHRGQTRQYQEEIRSLCSQKAKFLRDSTARNERRLNDLLDVAAQAASLLRELKDTLAAGYYAQYEFAQRNARWLGIDIARFPTPTTVESFIQTREDRLCSLAPTVGSIARQAAISVDPSRLKALDSYPMFSAELGLPAKSEEAPEWLIEQPKGIRLSAAEEPYDVELSRQGSAPRPTSSLLNKPRLAILGGLVIALLVVFSCLGALILLTQS